MMRLRQRRVSRSLCTHSSFHPSSHSINLRSSPKRYIMLASPCIRRMAQPTRLLSRCGGASVVAPLRVQVRGLKQSSAPSKKPVAFAFDIDGVLKAGPRVLEPARRALRLLEGENARGVRVPYVYITNGGGPHEEERAGLLQKELGVPVSPTQVIQAHTVMQSLVSELGDKPILMIGGPEKPPGASRAVMERYGFKDVYTAQDIQAWQPPSYPFAKVDPKWAEAGAIRQADFSKIEFAAVLVFHDSRDWGRDIQFMCDVLRSPRGVVGEVGDDTHKQLPLYFSHGDLLWGNDFSASRFGQGAFQVALAAVYKTVSGRDLIATTFGKPERGTYDYAQSKLTSHLAEMGYESAEQVQVWMIGDNPQSDIAGANGAAWLSALVRTGVYRDVEGPPAHTPTIIVDDVEQAVIAALEREWGHSPLVK